MQTVFKKTPILTDAVLHYCPGCGHGIVHRLVAEVVRAWHSGSHHCHRSRRLRSIRL